MIEDYIHEFKAPNGVASKCRIRTFLPQLAPFKDYLLIVASQLPEDEEAGMSVTNAAECIASGVMDKHQVQPTRLLWVEHYGARGVKRAGESQFKETFDLVTFDLRVGRPRYYALNTQSPYHFGHAKWQHMERDFLEQLIGEKFPVT